MKYFESKRVHVFPCSYRGTYTVGDASYVFDPEARLTTEANYINNYHNQGITNKDSYLVAWTPGSTMRLVVGGYYFEIDDVALTDLYDTSTSTEVTSTTVPYTFVIKTTQVTISSSTSTDSTDKTRSTDRLANLNNDTYNLDIRNAEDSKYYFYGLGLAEATDDISGMTATICPVRKLATKEDDDTTTYSLIVDWSKRQLGMSLETGTGYGSVESKAIYKNDDSSDVLTSGNASGDYSLAIGNSAEAAGNYSVAIGTGAKTVEENQIAINGTCSEGDAIKVGSNTATLTKNGDLTIAQNLTVNGTELKVGGTNLAVTSTQVSTNGNLIANGTATIGDKLTVQNNGALIKGNVEISKTSRTTSSNEEILNNDGTLTVANKLTVSSGGADIIGNTTITGGITQNVAEGATAVNTLSSATTINSTLTIGDSLTVSNGGAAITGDTTITGNTTITAGTLAVKDTITIDDNDIKVNDYHAKYDATGKKFKITEISGSTARDYISLNYNSDKSLREIDFNSSALKNVHSLALAGSGTLSVEEVATISKAVTEFKTATTFDLSATFKQGLSIGATGNAATITTAGAITGRSLTVTGTDSANTVQITGNITVSGKADVDNKIQIGMNGNPFTTTVTGSTTIDIPTNYIFQLNYANNNIIKIADGDDISIANDNIKLNTSGSIETKQIILSGPASSSTADTCYALKTTNGKIVLWTDGAKASTSSSTTQDISGVIQAVGFCVTSDARKKTAIEDYHCDKSILDLPIKKFEFINDTTHRKHIGCLAQDLQQICPELVIIMPDGYLTIDESKLVYLLLDEVKALKTQVESIKNSK